MHIAGRAPAGPNAIEGVSTMAACLPDNPTYCFYPAVDDEDEPPQIRILVDGFAVSGASAPPTL